MIFEDWTIETIENIQPEEFHRLVDSNRSHISKTFPVTVANCESLETTNNFFLESIEKQRRNEGYYFYIRHTGTKKLIGYACVKNINNAILKCELAYFIDKHFEGQGIISKVVSQTIDYCFNALNLNKVFICTSKINMASRRIATKHGFQNEGVLREEFRNGEGILEDIVYFGLLKSEYNER